MIREVAKGIHRFLSDEQGPTATEYAVMLALVIVVSVAAVTLLGEKVEGVFLKLDAETPSGLADNAGGV